MPLETLEFNFPSILPDLSSDFAINGVFSQENPDAFNNSTAFSAPAATTTPTPMQSTRQIKTPRPSTSRSHSSSGQSGTRSPQPFLQRYNERLRADNAALQDEVAMLRRKNARLHGQLDELRSHLRPLDDTLQELLYLPAVQEGDERVLSQLFGMLERITGVKRVLGSCQEV